ncbi:MAG: sugar ABC transporter substrate-binding protein [Christensenellales bacterium]|jgi:ribose transport system substrate-binding protein
MKKKKILALVLALLMVATLFMACSSGDGEQQSSAAPKEEPTKAADDDGGKEEPAPAETEAGEETGEAPKIAFIVKTLNNPFFIDMKNAAEATGAELGAEVLFQAPEKETDIEKQVQMVDNMVISGVDALVLSAAGPVELIPSIIKANEANIPVILVNDDIDYAAAEDQGAEYATYVGIDQLAAAGLAGSYVAENYPDGAKIAILTGVPGVTAAKQRAEGFRAMLTDDKWEVVAEQAANWERDMGFNVMQNILTSNPDVNVIYASNDMMAFGAMEACTQAGLSDQVGILGFDATDEAKDFIREGKMLGSVAQFPADMGKVSIECAIKAINGETLEKATPTAIELITIDNVDN